MNKLLNARRYTPTHRERQHRKARQIDRRGHGGMWDGWILLSRETRENPSFLYYSPLSLFRSRSAIAPSDARNVQARLHTRAGRVGAEKRSAIDDMRATTTTTSQSRVTWSPGVSSASGGIDREFVNAARNPLARARARGENDYRRNDPTLSGANAGLNARSKPSAVETGNCPLALRARARAGMDEIPTHAIRRQ